MNDYLAFSEAGQNKSMPMPEKIQICVESERIDVDLCYNPNISSIRFVI